MKTVYLDGNQIRNMEDVHDAFAQALELPEWYGRNLDALYDCLSDEPEAVSVQIYAPEALEETLEGHWYRLLRLLEDAAEEGLVEVLMDEESFEE